MSETYPGETCVDDSYTEVLTLDGPSGTGKSTVARRVAQRLGARYLDTGAMYRAAALAVLRAGVDPGDADAVAAVVQRARIVISTDPGAPTINLDGTPVDAEIRSAEVTAAVSAVSAVPAVRAHLVAAQRGIIGDGGIVVEGRDIGSVVWPNARSRVYLTASAEVRARRRAGELQQASDVSAVAADIERRDRLDSTRATSPLTRPEGSLELDTTRLGIDDVVERLVAIARTGTSP